MQLIESLHRQLVGTRVIAGVGRRRPLVVVLSLAVIANLILLSEAPLALETAAALILSWALPGILVVAALAGASDAPPEPWEWSVYGAGAGYGAMVLTMLAVSAVPGGVSGWQTLAAFDLLLLVLLAPGLRGLGRAPASSSTWPSVLARADRRWLAAGLLSLLLVGGFYRSANLGYAEFQGDEARAVLRAAAVIQGYDDVLLIHRKGPAEILIPATIYSLTGRLTEQAARLPFALANLAGLFALFLLGWRLFGPIAGWAAAMLLALDGYFIGFARIVQYQSVVFLTSVLLVLVLYRLTRMPRALPGYLILSGFLLVTGMLAHYEAGVVALPSLYLLWVLWRRAGMSAPRFGRVFVAPVLVSAAILAAFYLPFVLHPYFRQTLTYLVDQRIGGNGPYNHLLQFFERTTVYSTTYYLVLMFALTILAMVRGCQKVWGRRLGTALGGLATLGMTSALLMPRWLVIGERDYTFAVFLLALAALWLGPNLQVRERLLWLWFGMLLVAVLFFVAEPGTHVYVFFIPWALLNGWVITRIYSRLVAWAGRPAARASGVALAVLGVGLFGTYAYLLFVQNAPEVLLTWPEHRPRGYWTVYDRPDYSSTFGFPLNNGWKVAGWLQQSGVIAGPYATNESEDWVPDWYLRGAARDHKNAEWFFEIENLENRALPAESRQSAPGDFQLWGVVHVKGVPKMRIYRRGSGVAEVQSFDLELFEARFDAQATPEFRLKPPAIYPRIQHPMHVNLGNLVWLEGYDLVPDMAVARPGDTIQLVLYWRAQGKITESLRVFNHLERPGGQRVAQDDGIPVTGRLDTTAWVAGELIVDTYTLTVDPAAPAGNYVLLTGLYHPVENYRLDALGPDGQPVADAVRLQTIAVSRP